MSFAEYLLQRGAVSPEDLLRCIDYRRWLVPFVGTLAVNRGFLSAVQVLGLVEDCERRGMHFGDIAVERDFLSREQVNELLQDQRRTIEPMTECLVKLNILTRVQVEDLSTSWRAGNGADTGAQTSRASDEQ